MRTARGPIVLFSRLLGIFLFIVPFLPLPAMFADIKGIQGSNTPTVWILGILITFLSAWLVCLLLPEAAAARLLIWKCRGLECLRRRSTAEISLVAVLAVVLFVVSRGAYLGRPHLIDSMVQLFQAKIFASGRVSAPTPPLPAFFMTQHMLMDQGGWYSQYPPGHSLILALGVLLGAPWLVPILLSLGTALLLYGFALEAYDRDTALATLLLLLFCPFFFFMGASHMNHVSALFGTSLFLWSYSCWEREPRTAWAALAGVGGGILFLSRPLDAVAVGTGFFFFVLPMMSGRRRLLSLSCGMLVFFSLAALSLIFNSMTTGDPLLPGYIKLWGENHGLGFHPTPWGGAHSPLGGLRDQLVNLSLLNEYLFEWPIPALLPLALLLLFARVLRGWDLRLLLSFFLLPAAYFFYWHRDCFLGPRFIYSSLAFLIPLMARTLVHELPRLKGGRIGVRGILRSVDRARFASVVLLLSFAYAVFVGVPQRFLIYASSMKSVKLDLIELARKEGIDRGLIFVSVSWGSRLLAELRELGVSASLAERAYRNTDHCLLDEIARRARREGKPPAAVAQEVEALLARDMPVRRVMLNGDPTLRLRENVPLSSECRDEVLYDQGGYTPYEPHLASNSPDLDGPFVIARDLRSRNRELTALYPSMPAYLFRGGKFVALSEPR